MAGIGDAIYAVRAARSCGSAAIPNERTELVYASPDDARVPDCA
jgi:hypothetical protein